MREDKQIYVASRAIDQGSFSYTQKLFLALHGGSSCFDHRAL